MKNMTLEQKVQRALDYMEIQNVMGRHMYYHAAGKHEEELENIWVKTTPDPTWSNNNGVWVGMDKIRQMYIERHARKCGIKLEKIIQKHPEVENKRENWGMGTLNIHPLTTPVIEIAEDGKTARGIWYSPGVVTDINDDGEQYTEYKWEKYGVDFAKEEDGWKIWHIQMCYDVCVPPNKGWDEYVLPLVCCMDIEKDQPPKFNYKHSTITTVPQILPELPMPYKTFKDVTPY